MRKTEQSLVFTADILNSENQPLPKIQHQSTTYIVGTPGEEFLVRAKVRFNKPSPLARPIKPQFKVYAKVDGQSVGYSKICYAADNISGLAERDGDCIYFRGWGNGPCLKRQFIFAPPGGRESGKGILPLSADISEFGRIELRFREAKRSDLAPEAKGGVAGKGPEGTGQGGAQVLVVSASDGKFFNLPSLSAGGGEVLRSTAPRGRAEVKTEKNSIKLDLSCRFETAEVLLLRGILKPENLTHLAILEAARAKARTSIEAASPPVPTNPQHLRTGPSPSGGAPVSSSSDPPETRGPGPGGAEAAISDPLLGECLQVLVEPQGGVVGRENSSTGVVAGNPDSRLPDGGRFEEGGFQREESEPGSAWEAEIDEYTLWAAQSLGRRTRGALITAAREGRGPVSVSVLKKRAAEKGGLVVEKRKRVAPPREKVTIDLTARLGEMQGDDVAYMAVVEKLPAPGVVRLE